MVGNQRNEADEFAEGNRRLPVYHANELQLLRVGGADGNDHSSEVAELGEQSGRQIRSRGGDEDRVERSFGGKTERTVSIENTDIRIAERGQNVASAIGESGVAFDGNDLRC